MERQQSLNRRQSFTFKDGTASVEQHLGILLEDISRLGAQANISAGDELVLREAFLGLHYVWRMRIHNNLDHLDKDLMERLRQALLMFLNRVKYKGPRFIAKAIPTRTAAFSLVVFSGLVKDVPAFRELVNTHMSIADLRRALSVHRWLAFTEVEVDEEDAQAGVQTIGWTTVNFEIEELRKLVVETTLYLVTVLGACQDWKELVEEEGHAAFQKYAKEVKEEDQKKDKALIAPKGTYWDVPADKVLKMFRTKIDKGLTEEEVVARREVYGDNRTPEPDKASLLSILLRQLMDFIVLILLLACVVSAAMGDYKTAIVLGVVIFINTVIGFWQEWNAERAISALESLSVPQCTVVRGGEQKMVDSGDLVPGDIVVLEEGAAVPADLRLCQVAQLAVIETLLTGESVPIDKHTDPIKGHRRVNIGDRLNMAFQSTVVSRGRGIGVVVNTGETTEIGRISAAIATTHVGKTPLQQKLERLGKLLVALALFACALIIGAGLAWKPKDVHIVKTGVSLALSVIPEGLVAIVTLTMALGMKRMAKRNALVRQLPAVETLGSVTTICSDKTGTITEGIMRARLLWSPASGLQLPLPAPTKHTLGLAALPSDSTAIQGLAANAGAGGSVLCGEALDAASQWQLAVMDVCNNSSVSRNAEGDLTGLGDQTEVALKILAVSASQPWASARLKRGPEVAFDSDRKRMSVICEVLPGQGGPSKDLPLPDGSSPNARVVLSKGAPEVLIGLCDRYLSSSSGALVGTEPLTPDVLKQVDSWCDSFSAEGLRTLALAVRVADLGELGDLSGEAVEQKLVLVGLVALADPPRKGIEQSISACHAAGVRVVMITGDHVRTASSIARTIGILPSNYEDVSNNGLVVNGGSLSSMTIEQLAALEPFPVVFSRVSPDNKLSIVKALQLRGDVAAMTGDGVNDAPAIRQADVGVAMGRSGTDITRQAADIILADDNFSTIVVAVEEGRKIFENITKFIVYLLSCNLSEVVLMLVAVAVGFPAPLNALQILYANIVVDIPPSLALGAEKIEPDAMLRPPRNPKKAILGKRYLNALIVQALSIGLLSFAGYALALTVENRPEDEARSECFAIVFLTQCSHAFMSRSVRNSLMTSGFKDTFLGNPYLFWGTLFSIVAVIAGIYIPGFNDIFGLVPIQGWAWLKVAVAITIHLIVVEVGKYVIRRAKPALVLSPADSARGGPEKSNNVV